jgi:hypothetical protein
MVVAAWWACRVLASGQMALYSGEIDDLASTRLASRLVLNPGLE